MSKFCSNCGNALPDDAMFCGNCGSADPAPQPPAKQTLMQKVKSFSLKIWLIIAAAVVVLGVGIWLVVGLLTNTYETPVKLYVDTINSKTFSWDTPASALNGFAEDEFNAIMDIVKKSYYAENIESSFERSVEFCKREYGDNYKFSYEIEDKEKLDKDDLDEYEEEFNKAGKGLIDQAEQITDIDSWAEKMDLSTAQTKKLIRAVKAFGRVLKDAKVTEGYELTVTITTKGSELDEPEEEEITMYVFKVNGRWVSQLAFSRLPLPFL